MSRVYIADSFTEKRSALRLVLLDLNLEIAGEANDWSTALAQAPVCRTDILLVDWDLLPSTPGEALLQVREACPAALIILLASHLDPHKQDTLTACADAIINKGETPERVTERLRIAAESVAVK